MIPEKEREAIIWRGRMADIFDLPDNLSRKGLEKMAGIKYNPDKFFEAERRMTNLDRIQGMSAEQLADLCSSPCPPPYEHRGSYRCYEHPKDRCRGCWIDWIKSPAEGEMWEVADNGSAD